MASKEHLSCHKSLTWVQFLEDMSAKRDSVTTDVWLPQMSMVCVCVCVSNDIIIILLKIENISWYDFCSIVEQMTSVYV